jgi:rsbT co-antagonist protein RsbR
VASLTEQRRGRITAGISGSLAIILCVMMLIRPDLYRNPVPVFLSYAMFWGSFLQMGLLVKRGRTQMGAGLLLLHLSIYVVGAVGMPASGVEVIHILMILIAGLLIRWWAGFVVSVLLTMLLLSLASVGLAVPGGNPALIISYGLLLMMVAGVSGMYARSLETALITADEQATALRTAQATLQTQNQQLQEQAAELATQRERLAQQVDERTAELQQALAELRRSAITLQELQNPLVPIAQGAVVVPLVGAFDTNRAERFVSELLGGITQHRARTIVLDITGLTMVDTLAVKALLQAADAARLLGAQVVLAGVSPVVAQTIVSLGLELHTLRVERDLQSAVQHVLAGNKVIR